MGSLRRVSAEYGNKARKVSELIKILSAQPYKLKYGFLEFWIPTYLFIKRQDFALYDASKGAFIPNVNMEFSICYKSIRVTLRLKGLLLMV